MVSVNGGYLNKVIKPVLKLKSHAFRKISIGQMMHVKIDINLAINESAGSMKFILLSNGLSAKVDAKTQQLWRNRRRRLIAKVGYAGQVSAGRESDPAKLRLMKERKWALKEGREIEKIRKGRDWSTMSKLIKVYRAAIGDDGTPNLRPYSRD